MLRAYWKPTVAGFVGMLLAAALWLAAVHLYQDHQTLHALVTLEVQRAQAAAAPK